MFRCDLWGILTFDFCDEYQFPNAERVRPKNQKIPPGPWNFLNILMMRFDILVARWTGSKGV